MYSKCLKNLISIDDNFYHKRKKKVLRLDKELFPGRKSYFRIERFLKRLSRKQLLEYTSRDYRNQLASNFKEYIVTLRSQQSRLIKGAKSAQVHTHWLSLGFIDNPGDLNNYEIMLSKIFRTDRSVFSRPWGGWKYIKPIEDKRLAITTGNRKTTRTDIRRSSGNNKAVVYMKLISVLGKKSIFSIKVDFFDRSQQEKRLYVKLLRKVGKLGNE
jgi:hypothetical protein